MTPRKCNTFKSYFPRPGSSVALYQSVSYFSKGLQKSRKSLKLRQREPKHKTTKEPSTTSERLKQEFIDGDKTLTHALMCLFSDTSPIELYMIRKPFDLQILSETKLESEAILIRFNGGFNRK